jgi:hypothetical protein
MVANLEQIGVPTRRFLKLVQIIFHVLAGGEDQLRVIHPAQIRWRRLVFMWIDTRLNQRRNIDMIAPDLLHDLCVDGGKGRNCDFVRGASRENGHDKEARCEQDFLHDDFR